MAHNPFNSSFDTVVDKAMDDWHIPGISFSVVHGEDTWSKGYGFAQREPRESVEPGTLFYAASTTKAQLCASWAIYMASEQNKTKPDHERISWSTPLADIIGSDFVLQDPVTTRQVTLEDSVSHRTGMARHELTYGKEGVNTVKGVTRNLRNLPLHNTLRTHFEYCNTMYIAATHALETVTGKDFSQIVRESLWEPLGMKHTYAGYSEAATAVKEKGEVLAKGFSWTKLPGDPTEQDGHLVEEPYMDFPEVSGAGYVISTADDYAKWMRCLLYATSPLNESMTKEFWTSRSLVPQEGSDCVPFDGGILTYSLGWFSGSYKGHKIVWHPGGLHGAGSMIILVPDLKWGTSFFTNGHDGGAKLRGLGFELLDIALGLSEQERVSKEKVYESFLNAFKEAGESYRGARGKLYPDVPATPTIPLTLPFERYAGTYTHLGYGSITFGTEKTASGENALYCDWERCWSSKFWLTHVNAESWFLTRAVPNSPLLSACKAESKIGANGKVEGFNIAMEPTMPDTMMWFGRS